MREVFGDVADDVEQISGYAIDLAGERSVWLGRDSRGANCVIFTNKSEDTKLTLTDEALDALILLAKRRKNPEFVYVAMTWERNSDVA